jgi:flavin reductase (DIM6/NTAB) family NADH-FMN oxidoreductase RutF
MVALAVNNKHQSTPRLKEADAFAVNLIAEGEEGVAKTYYGPAESGYDKLQGTSVTSSPVTNSPLIPGNCGYLDCQIKQTVTAGNHTIFIAEVKAARLDRDKPIMTTANSKLVYTG